MPLVTQASADDRLWACDGIFEDGECLSGLTGYGQAQGMRCFRCKLCYHFDYCEKCFERATSAKPCNETCDGAYLLKGAPGADPSLEGQDLSASDTRGEVTTSCFWGQNPTQAPCCD